MATYLKGIGDSLSRVNEIIPSFDAKIFNYLCQNSGGGICWSESNRFALTHVDRGVNIGAGMAHAYGYFGMSDSVVRLDFIPPSGSAQYARVMAEINLSTTPHRFNIRATAQSSTTNISLTQNNLSTTPSGIYQIPLYLLTIHSNGTITATDQRTSFTKPEHAKNAEHSTSATNATNLVSGGNIASNVTATTQSASDNSTRIATTAYAKREVTNNNVLSYTSSTTSARNSFWGDGEWGHYKAANGLIFQWHFGNDQSVTFKVAFPTKCLFVGYVGHHGGASNNSPWASDVGISYGDISRTGFKWKRQSGTSGVNQRKYFAIGY